MVVTTCYRKRILHRKNKLRHQKAFKQFKTKLDIRAFSSRYLYNQLKTTAVIDFTHILKGIVSKACTIGHDITLIFGGIILIRKKLNTLTSLTPII